MRGKWWSIGALALAPLILVACEKRDVPTANRPDEAVVLTGQPGRRAPGHPAEPARRLRVPLRNVAAGSGAGRRARGARHRATEERDRREDRALLHRCRTRGPARTRTRRSTPTTRSRSCRETCTARRTRSTTTSSACTPRSSIRRTSWPGAASKCKATDPLVTAGSGSWIYLFESDGTLDPAAGRPPLVDYDFVLLSGDYKSTYKIAGGAEPRELDASPRAVTPRTSPTAGSTTQLRISTGGATNVDILDRHKSGFAGTCDAHRGDVLGRRRCVHREQVRSGARDPLLPRCEQRHLHATRRDHVRGSHGRHDLPPRPPDPAAARLDGLQRRRDRDAVPDRARTPPA